MESPTSTGTKRSKASSAERTRTLLVNRDDASGFGLTLSGDRPVSVQTVRPGGAADRAGIREKDVIVKVNGAHVTQSTHTEVVDLIAANSRVALTVIQAPSATESEASSSSSTMAKAPMVLPVPSRNQQRVTAPQPPNTDAVRALTGEKLHTMQLMVEQERRNVEQLRQDLACSNSSKRQQELDLAAKRLAKLEQQLSDLKAGKASSGRPHSAVLPSVTAKTPALPPRPESLLGSLPLTAQPPPLPARNRTSNSSLSGIDLIERTPPPMPPRKGHTASSVPPPPNIPLPEVPISLEEQQHSASYHARTQSSPSSLIDFSGRISPRYETPPGTPPPPYQGSFMQSPGGGGGDLLTWSNLVGGSGGGDNGIINMEDDEDEFSDHETEHSSSDAIGSFLTSLSSPAVPGLVGPTTIEGSKPFEALRDLLCHHAHLAVFMNYVISNSDPAALFFYLITETYKVGTLKEMQRWAYEIFSTFLVPDSPLHVPRVDNLIIDEIDRALKEDFDKEDVLRKLFWKARGKARDVLKEQLSEFRDKRAAGLGGIFGPPDQDLKLCIDNRTKELQVIDDLLLPLLESSSQDLDNATDKSLAVASSLATVLHRTFQTRSHASHSLVDKCPQFVSKEKRQKIFGKTTKKPVQRQRHNFEPKQFFQIKYCNHSQELIWGIAPQGFQCAYCGFDVHKKYVHKVEELCVGPSNFPSSSASAAASAAKKSDKKGGIFGRILSERELPSRKSSSATPGPNATPGKDSSSVNFKFYDESADIVDQGENRPSQLAKNSSNLVQSPNGDSSGSDKKEASPSKSSRSSWSRGNQEGDHMPSGIGPQFDVEARSGNRVDRSQSCKLEKKDIKRGTTRERRKHSDPNIPRSAASDADSDATPQLIADHQQSGSSSTSSLSARSSLDSPATSMQDMAGGRSTVTAAASLASAADLTSVSSSSQFQQSAQTCWDSDFETEPDPPDWRLSIDQDDLGKLNPRERKRQDVINEFFHTEKSHVRNLKVLDRLFCKPLMESGIMPKDLVERLFPNLEEVLNLHNQYNQKMKERAKAGFPVGNIGDMLCEMFDGPMGDTLIQVGAEFTKNQKLSIEELKERRKRDHKFDLFLTDQERRPECRRLGLQALLPVEHQRLVKYPLLLEQLSKQCDKEGEEFAQVRRCVDRSREILESIDKQVAEAQNIQRLAEIQRNLDTSGLEKMPESPICSEYRSLDLTKHRLIYDGPLTMKLGDTKRFKTIDLHVVLLEDCIMLLQKQDDKYMLKFHTFGSTAVGNQGHKFCHSPVIKFSTMLVRPVATDKRAFYLLNTTQNGPQIYELVASSTADRTQWFRHITEASNAYKARDSRRSRYPADPHNGLEGSGDRSKMDDHLGIPELDKKGQPAGRSQSFHEQSTSSREPHPERQPSSPPEDRGDPETVAQKAAGDENGNRKRFQRVEILNAEPCPLIDPSQVVVTQGEILVADPVLTPIEKIRRKDIEVARALEEKHRLVAEYYRIQLPEDHEPSSSSLDDSKDAREVLLAALVQVKSLSDLVNESLSLTEEDAVAASSRLSPAATKLSSSGSTVPTLSSLASEACIGRELSSMKVFNRLQAPTKLIAITKNMNQYLTSLLEIIQDRDDERERLRRELQRAQEQVHNLLSQSSIRTSSLSVTSPASRPASFISVEESSGPELSERNHESEDDAASLTAPTTRPQTELDASSGTETAVTSPAEDAPKESLPECTTETTQTIEENTEDDSAV